MRRSACIFLLLHAIALPAAAQTNAADAIVTGARIWTGNSAQPYADALAVGGDRILAVGTTADIEALAGATTQRMHFDGAFIVPGLIDNHTHFERAGELLLGVNLLAVASDTAFIRAIRAARDRMPPGAWLTAGEWGAYEAWAQSSTGRDDADEGTSQETWSPSRALIDSITPNTPVLVNRWDRSQYLANGTALELAGATCAWDGVECAGGVATGRLTPDAARRVRGAMPPKPLAQRMAEARTALADLASHGVTTIHDNTSADQMRVYQELRAQGELTVRVYARPTLDKWDELRAAGIRHGFGDEWIRIGGLKGFVDGIMGNSSARFYEPQLHSGERGSWRTMMTEPPGMLPLLIGADSSGHWPQVHAIGDEAIDTLLTMFEEVMRVNGSRERRFRLIHTQVMRDSTVAERMARLGIIAEVQPFHAIDDMRWMEERIGERARWAYAFRTLQDAGVTLSFGSDWPGTNAAWYPAEPLLGIYAAVTRQTVDGAPAGGWFPQERIDVETALRAYTVNNAWAADEDDIKGSLVVGKLADFVVLDASPFDVAPEAIKDIRVLRTVVGGEVLYSAPATMPGRGEQASDTLQRIDWAAVDAAMGLSGSMQAGDVYRYGMPRSDLNVTADGVRIGTSLALGSWLAFKQSGPNEAVAMGDLVLTEDEYNRVIARLQEGGVGQTAVHKHLPDHSPALWWTHVHAHGDPVQIARTVRAALALSATPFDAPARGAPPRLEIDTAQIARILGHTGRDNGGVYGVSVPRAETIRAMGIEIPPSMGMSTVINFQPTSDGRAVINGDFVMTADEVDGVIAALGEHGIQVVSLHNHLTDEQPRLFFMHFWAHDDAMKLAHGLRAALDRTNSRRGSR